ncbi:hypothetical protein COLO4_20296 [Corchorus olitorius]|uniref:Chromosome transmission fidelity protein 18 homolog n=1 Tax=Corchorus olitorius TaxID=93759 RepID=A0A1R3J0G8_9ROSI|nr:hypothetical protein COLO4_20296 [Corchorus olitorius]
MDMDMDMDIPLPEELELLEADSHFYEPYVDPPSPDPSPPRSAPSEHFEIDGPKRPRNSVEEESPREENKRTKTFEIEEEGKEDDGEDWLRYSPPPQENNVAATVEKDEKVYLSRYMSAIDGACMPITAPSGGERVYAKISTAQRDERSKKLDIRERFNGLISEPVNVLLQRAEQQAFTKALQASSEDQSDVTLLDTPVVHEQLWVDKYAPSSFTELLSDEQTNREVLLWLKQWDSCVFGSEIRSTSEEVLSALRRHSSTQHQKSFDSNFSGKSRGHRWSNGSYRPINNVDQGNKNPKGMQDLWNKKSRLTGPPEQKILLLCGPPGLGKTTLAHVAAKHCGYRVVEVNASDDRSSSTIEAKILDVVQMNSVMADSKPKCLVIDEIDGALGDGKGAVEVICICNDLYAPALRPLRQVAKLKYICNKEGVKTSSIALTALAEYTECDIRSCLNTLQFLNKKKEALNVMDISSQVVGRKDMSKSAFDIWKEVALHLLSETEKNDLAQLVNIMVSYSITYKNMKSDSPSTTLGQEAIVDALVLTFDPPIAEFIKYKDYISDHQVLALAMRQVVLHEVEKQKILQVSTGKSVNTTDGSGNTNQELKGASEAKSAKIVGENACAGAKSSGNVKNISNTRQSNSTTSTISSSLVSSSSATASAKQKSTSNTRKPPNGFNFFERFRKPSSKGSQDPEIAMPKEATLERDKRPLLFKFNEGFTNAVKRPVRMREFLL